MISQEQRQLFQPMISCATRTTRVQLAERNHAHPRPEPRAPSPTDITVLTAARRLLATAAAAPVP